MQEKISMFKKALLSGNIVAVHNLLKKYQHDDIANWPLDEDGYSALHYLSSVQVTIDELHRRRLARLLLEFGANVNLKAKLDITPIFKACELPSELLVELFIKHGADVVLLDASDRTVLFSAVENNEVDMLVDLIGVGANAVIDAIDEQGDAAIHRALTDPLADIGVLHELINGGANLDLQNENGHTILHLNVLFHKNEAVTRLLLDNGADYLIEDKEGITALQSAAQTGFYPLIDWLIEAGVSLEADNAMLLENCVENFKIVLLENPTLIKPDALNLIFNDKITYLSNKWRSIQSELLKMQTTKIGFSEYYFYDILSEKNPARLKNIFSNQVVVDTLNNKVLEAFPNFSVKIKSLKNYMNKIEGVGTSYSIYDIYAEKDANKLAKIFLNKQLENKVKELVNNVYLDSVVRGKLWRNLKIGVERRELLQVSLDYNNDSSGVKHFSLEMIQEILKYLSSDQLRDIAFTNLSAGENREIDSDLVKNVAQLFILFSSHTGHDRHVPLIFRRKNAEDVFVFLGMLCDKQFTAVFDYVKKNLPLVIRNADDLYIAFENLNAEQRIMLFNCFENKLPSLIKKANDFYYIYKGLNVTQRAILFDQVKGLLPSFIQFADDFYRIYKNLNSEQRAILFDSTKEALPSIIENADDFYLVFMNLNIEQRVDIFAKVKEILPSIIHSADDFYAIFKHLNSEQRATVFEGVKINLLSIISRADDFYLILENLNSEQRAEAFNLVGQKLALFIRCSDDFYMLLDNLNEEQRAIIFNSAKERLFLLNAYDFYIITKNLNEEQRAIIFNEVKYRLALMVVNTNDVYYVFKHLNSEQHAMLFENVKQKLIFVVNYVDDLTTVFSVFNTAQRLEALKILEAKLPFIIRNADDYSAVIRDLNSSERTYFDQLLEFHKYNLLTVDSSSSSSLEDCLPGPSGHGRRKRNTLEEACQFSWEEVDKFNAEKEKSREFNEIKINSDQFIATLKNPSLSESKRAQLLKLADKFPVTGASQERVSDLIKHQKNLRYLHKIGYLSGMATQGMMVKNTLRDFFLEDYKGVAINIGFIAGGQGFAKMAVAASVQGKRFIAKGQRLLGQSLRVASPFLARGTSVFIAYDLVEQIKAYKKGNPDAAIAMLGDGIYLGVDGVEIGIEIAEGLELLEGVSSVTGPIGATIGAVVFIGTDIYSAVKLVDKIDQQIHLTGSERLIEGLRAFVGMQPERSVEKLLQEKQINNELYAQRLAFLKSHTTIRQIIFPTVKVVSECIAKFIPKTCQPVGRGAYGRCSPHSRVRAFDPGQLIGGCTSTLKTDLDNVVLLEEKKNDIKWSRVKPDATEGNLFCFTGGDEVTPSDGAYFCDKAMGIEYPDLRTGNTTIIQLGNGNDRVVGFSQGDHILMLGNGQKTIRVGNGKNIFLLEGSDIRGVLLGGSGTNILDLGSFAKQKKYISIRLLQDTVGYLNASTQSTSMNDVLNLYQITDFLLRPNKQDFVHTVCNPYSIDARGGENQDNLDIIIISESYNCTHALKLSVRPYTKIINRAKTSEFIYRVPSGAKGEATVNLKTNDSQHRFVFNDTLHDIQELNKTDDSLRFVFINGLTLSVTQPAVNTKYQFRDQLEIKVVKNSLYAFQSTNQTISEIINRYPRLANQLKLSFIMQLPLMNESIVIGYNKRDVLSNDPYRRSHLMGNGGEDVFVVTSGYKTLDESKLPIPEVLLYDLYYETSLDTLDLSNIKRQLEKDLGLKIQVRASAVANDVVIELLSDALKPLVTVRLKEAFRISWHERLHIIINHVPMRFKGLNLEPVPLAFGPDKDIIMINPEDVEENTTLVVSKKSGDYRFSRILNNLLISNAFANNLTAIERYTISLQAFYQTPKLETLSIQFSDKEIVLKSEMVKIEHAVDFTAECEQYNRTMYDLFFNKNVGQENRRLARHVPANGVEKTEENKNSGGIMTSYVLPIVGAIAAVFGAGIGYRYQARNRLRANTMPAVVQQAVITLPLLTPTVEAKSTQQQEKIGSNHQESYSEQKHSGVGRYFADHAGGNFSLLKYLLHYCGGDSAVARMNQVESVLSNTNHDVMSSLDLAEQRFKKALGANDFMYAPKSTGTSWATKKNTASFFPDSVASMRDQRPSSKLIGLASGT